jgi:hypothetical protein
MYAARKFLGGEIEHAHQKGFDPYSQEVAQELWVSLFQMSRRNGQPRTRYSILFHLTV